MHDLITGIQQIGIGVINALEAKQYYNKLFGMDVLIFDDTNQASLMSRYTGHEIHTRQAILTMNLCGGGGFEIWQFLSKTPAHQPTPVYGDIGIFACKIKTPCLCKAQAHFQSMGKHVRMKEGGNFYVTDNYNNTFEISNSPDFIGKEKLVGGVMGAVIGVSDLTKSIAFYEKLLSPCIVETAVTHQLDAKGNKSFFRVAILKKKKNNRGAFSHLFGDVTIELVQNLTRPGKWLFENRQWGDCGFIHLCFDVLNMEALKATLVQQNVAFTVDSDTSFGMQNSSGRFCYIEDPDGTLIELVETHKIPVVKKLGWYYDLRKRKANKPLPAFMINMLRINKIK